MASANTNKTIWTLGIVGILGFLAYKLWPAIRRAINGGSGGGGGGAVGGGSGASNPNYPFPQNQSPNAPQLSFSAGQSAGGNNLGPVGNALQAALQNLIGSGSFTNSTPSQQAYIDALSDEQGSDYTSLESAGLPLETTQNFDVNQLAYSPGDDGSDYDGGLDTTSYIPDVDDLSIGGDDGGGGDGGDGSLEDDSGDDDDGDFGD